MTIPITGAPPVPGLDDPATFNTKALNLFTWITGSMLDQFNNVDPNDFFSIATKVQAEAGTDNSKIMTALRTKEAIYKLGDARFASTAQGRKATLWEIRNLTTENNMTPQKVNEALGIDTLSGTSVTPNWSNFINAQWTMSANGQLSNPVNVIAGTTRSITVRSANTVQRTMTFGSNYKGDLPDVKVKTNGSAFTLYFYAVSATEILVSEVEW